MYSKKEKVVVWLSTFKFITYKKFKSIIDNVDDIENLIDDVDRYKGVLSTILKPDEIQELKAKSDLRLTESIIANYDKLNVCILTYFSHYYPETLKDIDTPPIILYCKGNLKLLSTPCLAVVGTRRATRFGQDITHDIVKEVASSGITIVSGLADGIDTVAHSATLDADGKTIAVIASGFNYIYPSSNMMLADKILSNGGLILSEYRMNEKPQSYNFPIRNRIIAGLSKAVVVAEATEKSGSMHTKNYALDYGREVFAIPGRISDIYSNGCNKLIKSGQAHMLLSSKDIIELYGTELKCTQENNVLQLSSEESCVYELLKAGEMHYNELLTATGLEPRKLNTLLMRLEINSVVKKLPGNVYSVN